MFPATRARFHRAVAFMPTTYPGLQTSQEEVGEFLFIYCCLTGFMSRTREPRRGDQK